MGSFDLALAIGFIAAARKPAQAAGMRWLVGAVAALLVLTAVLDVAAGRASLVEESPHLLTVAGWLLLCYLAATAPLTPLERDRNLPHRRFDARRTATGKHRRHDHAA